MTSYESRSNYKQNNIKMQNLHFCCIKTKKRSVILWKILNLLVVNTIFMYLHAPSKFNNTTEHSRWHLNCLTTYNPFEFCNYFFGGAFMFPFFSSLRNTKNSILWYKLEERETMPLSSLKLSQLSRKNHTKAIYLLKKFNR